PPTKRKVDEVTLDEAPSFTKEVMQKKTPQRGETIEMVLDEALSLKEEAVNN
ncbi:Hypothetical predicted protein, partial [Olea europaea subsp. europaea]